MPIQDFQIFCLIIIIMNLKFKFNSYFLRPYLDELNHIKLTYFFLIHLIIEKHCFFYYLLYFLFNLMFYQCLIKSSFFSF